MTFLTMPEPAADYRIKIGQRFHPVAHTSAIWQAMSVYRDAIPVDLSGARGRCALAGARILAPVVA